MHDPADILPCLPCLQEGGSALFVAAYNGRVEAVRALLQAGADVNVSTQVQACVCLQ
jgi:hypothetical protein